MLCGTLAFDDDDVGDNSLIEGAEACRQCEQSKLLPTLFTRRYYAVRRAEDRKIECHKIGYTLPYSLQSNLQEGNYSVDASRPVNCTMEGWEGCLAMNGILCEDSRRVATTYVLEEPTSCTLCSHGDNR